MADGSTIVLGIDIGGTGIKGAPVDLLTGELVEERYRAATPSPATPEAVATVVSEIADRFIPLLPVEAPIGIAITGVVKHGVVGTAVNIDPSWRDCDGEKLFSDTLGRPVHLVNDADAAGVAELRYGAAKDKEGLVIVTTLGTGIGVALLYDGVLIPNVELGHIELDGRAAERGAAASARTRDGLSYTEWATQRLQPYYSHLERLFSPDLFVVGGGVSRRSDTFLHLLRLETPIVPASLRNAAGIVGAAALAA